MKNFPKYKNPTRIEKVTLRLLIVLGLISILNFFYWFLNPDFIDNQLLYWLLMGPMIFDSLRIIYIWYHYWDISIPFKPELSKKLTADVFTTYFPGEPYEMVKETLNAIKKIRFPHTTYLCDEANDSSLKQFCKENGIIHVTRNNRINAKAGNINNALKQASGDICLILDPDHVPKPDFLDKVIPYFEDEKIGFVQTVQAYYNIDESSVAKGAAEQTFHFYGPIMMTMNSYGTVNAIGANCVFRRKALDSIGGHAPGLSEDMHTAMQLFAKGWKSVYVPEIFTKGLVPSSITSYYKQQLKWSRGTLELLVDVFPKLIKNFNWRQIIHFGILPLHYLSGIFYLIGFLIPILSLCTSTTPWKGNVINFGLIFLPVFVSILAVRFYVQRWVTDKSERGTHLIGGILLACTWWIFIIGFFYTLIRKKVPYLPTPKDDRDITSWKILVPNILIGIISLYAIIVGLNKDLTPFSLVMSGFALINAFLMFYTLRFAYQKPKTIKFSFDLKQNKNPIIDSIQIMAFEIWHKAALPLVIVIFSMFGYFKYHTEYVKWGGVKPEIQNKNVINYLGVFYPSVDNGISNLKSVNEFSGQIDVNFDIISLYLPWEKDIDSKFPSALLDSIYQQKSLPLITWEPWLNSFKNEINNDKHVFELINEGFFDEFILRFAEKLKSVNRPVFLRFANEFDNPFYPWYFKGDSASIKFKNAWIHTYEIFKKDEANNVIWVWNPWKSENILSFYPGKEYVDWIGVNILNYGNFNSDGKWYDFESLYEPFHDEIEKLPLTPVIISEFGSLNDNNEQNEWITDAFNSIEKDFDEIKSVIYFVSKVDKNWPDGLQKNGYLDWSINQNRIVKNSFDSKEVPDYVFNDLPEIKPAKKTGKPKITAEVDEIKGVFFQKGHDWRKDYHVLSRQNLEAEFDKIKALGINTIKFEGNSIYCYNVLKAAEDYNFNIAFGFWIPPDIDFMNDSLKTKQLKTDIINKLNKYKNNNKIISWNILDDVQYNQKDFYLKPRLLYQNRAYLIWLKDLIAEIKKNDSIRPVIVDLEINRLSKYHSKMMIENIDGIDGFGLVVKKAELLNSVHEYLNNRGVYNMYSEIDVDTLLQQKKYDYNTPFFIASWKDTHESNKLSFNGITDRNGREKREYYKLMNALLDTNIIIDNSKLRILRQTIPLYTNNYLNYYAMVYSKGTGWKYGTDFNDYQYEWSLIKCDKYGNYLAVKELGKGPVLALQIPSNYTYFRLLLTASNGQTITTDICKLNSPLKEK